MRSGNVHIRYAMPESSSLEKPGRTSSADRRIAYALGKKTGKAVKRNRLRRQLRAVFREISTSDAELLPTGDYLVRVVAFESSYRQLKEDVKEALMQLTARTADDTVPSIKIT